MSKGTVHAPGGPPKVYGMENTAYAGPQTASDGKIDGDPDSALSDFSAEDPVEAAYDQAWDDVDEAFGDIGLDRDYSQVHYTDESGQRMQYEDMRSEYAARVSEGESADDLTMVLSFANTGDEFIDAVNAKTMGIDNTRSVGPGWKVTGDNEVIIPVQDVVTGVHADEIEEYAETVVLMENEGPILSDTIASDLHYNARKNSFGEVDISMRIDDMTYSDLENHVHEHGDVDDENQFLEERAQHYRERVTVQSLSQAFSDLEYDGDITSDDLTYESGGEYYSMSEYTKDQIFTRALDDN